MKKIFCTVIILLITIFGTYLAVVPYAYNNRIKDPTSDLIFENTPSIGEANLIFDYSLLQEADNSLLGRINLNLLLDESNNQNKVMLPFRGALNNEISNFHSRFGKNVEIQLNGETKEYQVQYGVSDFSQEFNQSTYDEIKDNLYEEIEDDTTFYIYTFHLNEKRLGVDHWVLKSDGLLTLNLKIVEKLSRKERNSLKNTEYENHALLESTDSTSWIISKNKIDDYLTEVGEVVKVKDSKELYNYFLHDFSGVDLEKAIPVAQNEYNSLFDEPGFHNVNFSDLVNQERLMVYEFELLKDTTSINIKYNHIVGKDVRFQDPQFELDFALNEKNYKDTNHFTFTYLLDAKNRYLNFTILNLKKIDNGFLLETDSIPKETKIFFSATESPVKSTTAFKVELAGFSKYILIPVLFFILFIFVGINFINKKEKSKGNLIILKQNLKNYIPEILAVYLLAFKFFTLYTGDSSFNLVNSILVLLFLSGCLIYFVCKTMTHVNYYKLIFYSVLACFVGLLVQDVAFILLIALGVCFLEKGPKPYLRIMYMGIVFFSIQTILLAAYNVIPNPVFFVWKDEGIAYYRYAIGFGHPNTVSLFLFVGCLCYILYKKPSWLIRALMVALTIGAYFVTHSRTGCICVMLLLILDVLSDFIPLKGKWRYFGVALFPAFTILTIVFVRIFGSTQEGIINQFLSQRPYIMNQYFSEKWLTIKGINQLADWLFIDNLYLNVLIFQGLPCYLIYLVIYVIVSYKVIKSNHPKIFIGLIVYFVYSLFEATLMSYSCAIFIALLFITTLGDKYYMDGSLVERKERVMQRNLYIVKALTNLNLNKQNNNIILVLGKEKKEEIIDDTKILYVTKLSFWKKCLELLKYFDPDEIHLNVPNSFATFIILTYPFKGNIILHGNVNKGKLYKRATCIMED